MIALFKTQRVVDILLNKMDDNWRVVASVRKWERVLMMEEWEVSECFKILKAIPFIKTSRKDDRISIRIDKEDFIDMMESALVEVGKLNFL